MKPPPLDYVAPTTVADAVTALAQPGAVVLAGGQSLLLELGYRQRRPRLLVDVNGVDGLDGFDDAVDGLHIGALVRHRRVERVEGGSPVRRLLTTIAPWVAHPPVRNRGTFCGSLAWAHPAAEWNAVALAFDAEITVRSTLGPRTLQAQDWYLGGQRTLRTDDELVTEVRLAPSPPGTGPGFAEHRRTHASFAAVAVVAALTLDADTVKAVRLAAVGVADRPVRLSDVETALVGTTVGAAPTRVRALVRASAELATTDDDHRVVAAELAGRALADAAADAGSPFAEIEESGR